MNGGEGGRRVREIKKCKRGEGGRRVREIHKYKWWRRGEKSKGD